ncbi:hypothetical protein GQ42DRAFT_163539 [Ramicandelaber brevisporus]|nr:hypothetical protein GQ42DRAFT_165362 [Ramicandelaber brevisporus]KAI8869257.1 hypothetical protein GQ42DRAFT_163539 [Ramicandelaber brevisporus]
MALFLIHAGMPVSNVAAILAGKVGAEGVLATVVVVDEMVVVVAVEKREEEEEEEEGVIEDIVDDALGELCGYCGCCELNEPMLHMMGLCPLEAMTDTHSEVVA